MATARTFIQSVFLPSLFQGAGATTAVAAVDRIGDSVKPPGSAMADGMTSVTSVMRRQQCIEQHEALTLCVQSGEGGDRVQLGKCHQYFEAVRYCMLQTQQHNYPVNTAFLV